jgi:tetratricopeptide (TPR) repeat protein
MRRQRHERCSPAELGGYQSKHLLVKLGEDRSSLVENEEFVDLVCEIQVRTILQHAWAEMEHDIQYKNDEEIPLDLKKRFSALSGLLELADREFQNIQLDSDQLKTTVKATLIDDLTQQGLSERRSSSEGDGAAVEKTAATRDLVSQGRYPEAIEAYSDKLRSEPTNYTLFIGRARARFLAGDVTGAINDLDKADSISGNPDYASRLRTIIMHGDDPGAAMEPIERSARIADGLKAISDALSTGEGIRAFEEYTVLESEGHNKAFILFGKAMCCSLEKDTVGAREFLSFLQLRPATPMSVNITALSYILDILDGKSVNLSQESMMSCLDNTPDYTMAASSLRFLFDGFRAKGYAELGEILDVENSLRRRTT